MRFAVLRQALPQRRREDCRRKRRQQRRLLEVQVLMNICTLLLHEENEPTVPPLLGVSGVGCYLGVGRGFRLLRRCILVP